MEASDEKNQENKKTGMKLLTLHQWLGPSRESLGTRHEPSVDESYKAMVTGLSLGAALTRIREHERGFNAHYGSVAVNYRLLAVSEIEDLSGDEIADARIELVEDLDMYKSTEQGNKE